MSVGQLRSSSRRSQKRDGDKAAQLLADHPTIIDPKDGKGDTA